MDETEKPRENDIVSDIPPEYYYCDICSSGMYEHQCKYICPNCGNRVDCSDH